ncbi:MAG: hypothetical protein AB1656_13635 [Candidatus Omnitrophota bacterium]
MTETQAAFYLNFKQSALRAWRLYGTGPLYVRISGRAVRYRKIDLDRWIEARLRASTSDVDGSGAVARLAMDAAQR